MKYPVTYAKKRLADIYLLGQNRNHIREGVDYLTISNGQEPVMEIVGSPWSDDQWVALGSWQKQNTHYNYVEQAWAELQRHMGDPEFRAALRHAASFWV